MVDSVKEFDCTPAARISSNNWKDSSSNPFSVKPAIKEVQEMTFGDAVPLKAFTAFDVLQEHFMYISTSAFPANFDQIQR